MTRVAFCIPEITRKCIIDVKPLRLYFDTVLYFAFHVKLITRSFLID